MLEHTGSHATYASGMVLLPEEEFGVVVLMNLNDEVALVALLPDAHRDRPDPAGTRPAPADLLRRRRWGSTAR